MAIERNNLTRVFFYSAVRLVDPDASMTPDAVRDLYAAASRPELSNAEVRGPEMVANEMHYTFHRAVGVKGLRGISVAVKLDQFETGAKSLKKGTARQTTKACRILLNTLKKSGGNPMPLPSSAVPWLL